MAKLSVESEPINVKASENLESGFVIVNADDWGLERAVTDRTLDLILRGRISSGSAMVFMEDSERAAQLALEHGVDAGLHLNLTQPFTASHYPPALHTHQERLARFLTSHWLAPVIYRPDLASSFEYVTRTQIDEYTRLYGALPHRCDGHHHMHLCTNVIRQKLLPAGAIVRRNFTFVADKKGRLNRIYRGWQDRQLAQRFRMVDYFFDLIPIVPERLTTILELASRFNVEVETHPNRESEYRFLDGPEFAALLGEVRVARGYTLRVTGSARTQKAHAAGKDIEGGVQRQEPRSTHPEPEGTIPHIAVCVCTYKRPQPLLRLLEALGQQETQGLFTYSVWIVDNDGARSAAAVVAKFVSTSGLSVSCFAETTRGIARARNRVVTQAKGDYLAFIDDDEFPERDWLLKALLDCRRYKADGVLGPVLRVLEGEPPAWLEKSQLFQRPIYPSGIPVEWRASRTSNVLIRHSIIAGEDAPFRVELRAGEDQEFFHRKIGEGYTFVWSADAVVSEVIPAARQKRSYIIRRALLQGACESTLPVFEARSALKSAAAVLIYALILPFSLLPGGHCFMTLLEKFCFHAGKLLIVAGINPVREEYVSD